MIALEHITKQFGGVVAINDLNFHVKKGEIFGLIGPNGAGKTTAFNIISGNYTPTSGRVLFKQQDITNKKPNEIVKLGIARTFQNIRLFDSMSVLDNVLVGFDSRFKYNLFEAILRLRRFFTQEEMFTKQARYLLEILKLDTHQFDNAKSLSYGNQRKVEIARALATNPQLLLLDEPAAGMNITESEELADILHFIRRKFNLTIILIEHDMKFVQKVCDRVLVLDYGKVIFEGSPQDMLQDEEVIRAYLGDFVK
ncbi:MAG: ABC transporter ATP-binding protein [Epsilonproteobacteria bacterium]|nr:ABC transporter ATP-binding protein [Campylobacterota bacterium]